MSEFFDLGGSLQLPEMIEIEPTDSCNLRCRMCHVSYMDHTKKRLLGPEIIKKLAPLKGCFVSVASGFEPMMHPRFIQIMGALTDLDMRLQIITNGTYCTPDNIEGLVNSNMHSINFSFDGARKETFEKIRVNAHYEKTLDNIVATKSAFAGRDTFFSVNNTVMRSNLNECIEAIDLWEGYDFDMLRLLLMITRYPEKDLIQESLYPVRENAQKVLDDAARHVIENELKITICRPFFLHSALKETHPNNVHEEWVVSDNKNARRMKSFRRVHQYGEHPMMTHFKCRAPFNSATILANGDVQMCFKYSIGNLHDAEFEDIWYGEEADRVRKLIIGDPSDCQACDCFRFGMSSRTLDDNEIVNHFSNNLAPYLDTVDFEKGTMKSSLPPPQLIEAIETYNIVSYAGEYFGVPHSTGPLDLETQDISLIEGVMKAENYGEIKRKVRQTLSGAN